MLFFNRVSVSEGIDVNRNNNPISKECKLCHFYFFKDRNLIISLIFALDVMIYQCMLKT